MPNGLRVEMELRNLPRERILGYLVEAGGTRSGDLAVNGDDWQAYLEPMEPARISVMKIRRDMLVIEADTPTALHKIHAFMRRKTMRGGG